MILADVAMDLKLYAAVVTLLSSLAAVVVMQTTRRGWTRELVVPRLAMAALAIGLFACGLILLAVPCAPLIVGVVSVASTAILILIGPRAIEGIALA